MIVFACCHYSPDKETIKAVFELIGGVTSEQVQRVLEFTEASSKTNCLMVCYNLLAKNDWNITKLTAVKHAHLLTKADDAIEFLIELGREHKVDMKRLLSATEICGQTLFQMSGRRSKRISTLLVRMGIKVNSITEAFHTPSFQVSKLLFDTGFDRVIRSEKVLVQILKARAHFLFSSPLSVITCSKMVLTHSLFALMNRLRLPRGKYLQNNFICQNQYTTQSFLTHVIVCSPHARTRFPNHGTTQMEFSVTSLRELLVVVENQQ